MALTYHQHYKTAKNSQMHILMVVIINLSHFPDMQIWEWFEVPVQLQHVFSSTCTSHPLAHHITNGLLVVDDWYYLQSCTLTEATVCILHVPNSRVRRTMLR